MIWLVLALMGYAAAVVWVATTHLSTRVSERAGTRWSVANVLVACAAHGMLHVNAFQHAGHLNTQFSAALSLVALVMALLTALLALRYRVEGLVFVTAPMAVLGMLSYYFDAPPTNHVALAPGLAVHVWSSMAAYALLSIASLLAIGMMVQESALRSRHGNAITRMLPSLFTLESLMFATLRAGWVMLTIGLVAGVVFIDNLMAQHLAHKTVFSVLSWLVLLGLLIGRHWRGWRGKTAVTLTIVAMVLLMLGFFGSKLILQQIYG